IDMPLSPGSPQLTGVRFALVSGRRQRVAAWAASLAVLALGGWAGTALTDDPAMSGPPSAWSIPVAGPAPADEVDPSSAVAPTTDAVATPSAPATTPPTTPAATTPAPPPS